MPWTVCTKNRDPESHHGVIPNCAGRAVRVYLISTVMRRLKLRFLALIVVLATLPALAAEKPRITLDEFFNSVSFDSVSLSPDGNSVLIGTTRADWDAEIFREELWLYRIHGAGQGSLVQLTQSGRDSSPQFSPDGRWIAFLSERKQAPGKEGDSGESKNKESELNQLYAISTDGGEAVPVTTGDLKVHAFAWSSDSRTLFYATRIPWTNAQKDAYKKEWKDVDQYRGAERGDEIFGIDLAGAIARRASVGSTPTDDSEEASDSTPDVRPLAKTLWHVQQLVASRDGRRLAFVTESVSERQEKIDEFEVYSVELAHASLDTPPKQLTRNQAVEQSIAWAKDNKHVFFQVDVGSVEGKYKDTQTRLYWVDADTDEVERWAADFGGPVTHYSVAADGGVIANGRLGTEVQVYSESKPSGPFSKQGGWTGTYELVAAAEHSPRVAFVHSTLEKPTEVYVADSLDKIQDARPITFFNKLYTERELPKGKPYRWTADDGTTVEGMLMYPPGKFEAKDLPTFVFIHGGPADADGNHFEADWYQWDRLAANQGWLVFEPNYRGSSGYGDKFLMGIVPQIVSRPGKDILEGVDALVKDGIADPNRLAVGGYSYGGYMTNWLITQTTRFKAAVTGAGAVEHVANWGNDDTTFDDAYFLGGLPWEAAQRYHDEAAIFQIDKVKTPTHMVAGADDIRVAVLEDYLLDHALHVLGIPSTLLIFPGEGHSLDENPWHGKIKVREELKWLQKYGGVGNQ
jgi:dipeptidyl aminopeptidase/acylaminoacyl peptidase